MMARRGMPGPPQFGGASGKRAQVQQRAKAFGKECGANSRGEPTGWFSLQRGARCRLRTRRYAVKIVSPKKHGDARGFSPKFTTRPNWKSRPPLRICPGQPFLFRRGRNAARTAFPDPAVRPGQACSGRPGAHSRRRGRHPPVFPDLREIRRRRAVGGELAPTARPGRLRARLCHARARHRGPLQDDGALFAGARSRRRLGRSRHRSRLAAAAGGPTLSEKDRRWPRLKDAQELFE